MIAKAKVQVKGVTPKKEPLRIAPVELIGQEIETMNLDGLPEEWRKAESFGGFHPSPDWRVPGQALFGSFITMREAVGPNQSRVYEIATYNGKDTDSVTVAVWGSTTLDRQFDSVYPPVQQGDRVAILYLGTKDTKRDLKPVKLFELRVIRAKSE